MAETDSIVKFGDTRLPARFWSKVRVDERRCWLWTAYIDQNGYGKFGWLGRARPAHRIAFDQLVGPVPVELTCDHLCRVRSCVNPSHLEIVTRGENVLRGISRAAVNAKKTHCQYGHALSVANTWTNPANGQRQCRACNADRANYYYHARKMKYANTLT